MLTDEGGDDGLIKESEKKEPLPDDFHVHGASDLALCVKDKSGKECCVAMRLSARFR